MVESDTRKWTAGRIAALVFFIGGTVWAVGLFPESLAQPGYYFIQGLVVWLLWLWRALDVFQKPFPLLVWVVSAWHHALNLSIGALGFLFSPDFIIYHASIQLLWSGVVFLFSFVFLLAHKDA